MAEILIAYYSRTGKTKMVANKLAAMIGAELQEIRERKSRNGTLGFLGGIKDALLKRSSQLASQHSTQGIAAVVIGTPVWANGLPPAVRAYVDAVDLIGLKIFGFCTYDGTGAEACLAKLAGVVGRELVEILALKKPAKDKQLDVKLETFANRIRAATSMP